MNLDWTHVVVDGAQVYCRLDIPYPPAAGPGGPFRIIGYATPVDEHSCMVFFWRFRQVSGIARSAVDEQPRHQRRTAREAFSIDVLVRSGLVVERDFGEGFRRYEPARGEPHHEHLLCTVCGRVTEFRDERLERMTTLIAEGHRFARQRHRLVIYGVCDRCQRRA